jgi:ferredoxin like protein
MKGQGTAPSKNLDALLGLLKYETDDEHSHIKVDGARCTVCAAKPCLTVCPAHVYCWIDEHVAVRYENCLECGACQIACDHGGNGGITWRNPQGGFGIVFRCG